MGSWYKGGHVGGGGACALRAQEAVELTWAESPGLCGSCLQPEGDTGERHQPQGVASRGMMQFCSSCRA